MKTADPRNAIEAALAAVAGSKGPVVSEQQFLRELIVFANSGALGNVLASVPGLARDVEAVDHVHRQFRTDLQALIYGRLSAKDRKRIYASADRMLLKPQTDASGAVAYRHLPAGLEAAVAHAVRLLLDPGKGHAIDLKQCQWKDCNRIEDARRLPHMRAFFFVSERREAQAAAGKHATGKSPDRYCCEEHMRAAHREKATAATLKRRAELKAKRLKRAATVAAKHK